MFWYFPFPEHSFELKEFQERVCIDLEEENLCIRFFIAHKQDCHLNDPICHIFDENSQIIQQELFNYEETDVTCTLGNLWKR